MEINPTQRTPTRLVSSGTITILAGATSSVFLGKNSRQDRIEFTVTNLDTANWVKIQSTAGVNLWTVFQQRSFGVETNADLQIYNPNSQSIQVEVTEFYPDNAPLHK